MSYASWVLKDQPLQLSAPSAFSVSPDQMADVMDFVSTNPNSAVILPEEMQNYGEAWLFNSQTDSTHTFSVKQGQNVLAIIDSGETYSFVNTPDRWRAVRVASLKYSSTAPALAGLGLKSGHNNSLNVVYSRVQMISNAAGQYNLSSADLASLIVIQKGSCTIHCPAPFFEGFWFAVNVSQDAGALTIAPSGAMTINGLSPMVVPSGSTVCLVSDGQNFHLASSSPNPVWSGFGKVFSEAILPNQTFLNMTPLGVASSVLSFNTSPQNGSNSVLLKSCNVYMGIQQGSWDIVFNTNPNTLENQLTFVAGTASAPSSGKTVSFSSNESFSARIAIVPAPAGSTFDVVQIGPSLVMSA